MNTPIELNMENKYISHPVFEHDFKSLVYSDHESKRGVWVIVSVGNSGKTTMLKAMAREIQQNTAAAIDFVYIDSLKMPDMTQSFNAQLNLTDYPFHLSSVVREDRHLFVIIDGVDQSLTQFSLREISEMEGLLTQLATDSYESRHYSVIVAVRDFGLAKEILQWN